MGAERGLEMQAQGMITLRGLKGTEVSRSGFSSGPATNSPHLGSQQQVEMPE